VRLTVVRCGSVATAIVVVLGLVLMDGTAGASGRSAVWRTGGYDRTSNRHQPDERIIGPRNAGQLAEKWQFTTGGDVSATPSVDERLVYVPDFAGNVFALDRETGQQVWSISVASVTGIARDFARVTPAIAGDLLVLGDQGGNQGDPAVPGSGGAWLFALRKQTGELVWKTKVEDHFAALITQSPQLMGHTALVGVASGEEAFANPYVRPNAPGYVCCSFRGSFLSVDIRTGAVNWKTYLVPDGYTGAGVWGTTPSIDPRLNAVFLSTGNNYSVPPAAIDCLQSQPAEPRSCFAAGNHFDSMIALDLDTGAVRWARSGWEADVYTMDCNPRFRPGGIPGPNCPPGDAEGPDYDFGQAPQLLDVKIGGRIRKVAGAGQKSGDYWLLDRATGEVVWKTHVGPGGPSGGLQWGSASDGERIYVAAANSGDRTKPGYWAALDPATGAVLWKTDDPAHTADRNSAMAAVSVANGVVYACTEDLAGTHFAFDAKTGAVLWSSPSGGSCMAGAAIVDGTVYWGSGYRRFGPIMSGNNVFRAYTVPDPCGSPPA